MKDTGDSQHGSKISGEPFMASSDPALLFDAIKEVFDQVAIFMDTMIIFTLFFAVTAR